jgi:hypothetical protein
VPDDNDLKLTVPGEATLWLSLRGVMQSITFDTSDVALLRKMLTHLEPPKKPRRTKAEIAADKAARALVNEALLARAAELRQEGAAKAAAIHATALAHRKMRGINENFAGETCNADLREIETEERNAD